MDQSDDATPPPDPPRLRRPMPGRDGPDRSPRGRARPGPASAEPSGAGTTEIPDVVADAVRLGYQVVEENLRQGRAAADRFRARDYGLHDATDDVQMLGRRVVDLARELGSSWFDLVGAVLDDPRLRDAVRSHPTPPKPSPPSGGASISVCVIGHASATGDAFLEPLVGLSGPPQITPLRMLTGLADAAPIVGVRLGADPDTGAVALLAPVPAEQPPGVYAGTVHEAQSQRLLGSISLTVPSP